MMESVQKAMARQRTAQNNAEAFEPPAINNIGDIQHILQQLDPSAKVNQTADDVEISTELIGSDGRKSTNFLVNTNTSSKSYRQILIEGFQVIKQRFDTAEKLASEESIRSVEVNGKLMSPPPLVNTESRLAMDAVIERLLGGHRNGQYICWDLSDGYTYRYEIFQHRLTRVYRNAGDADPATSSV